MLEIYEEKVIDLLCISRECLQIRESKGAVFVSTRFFRYTFYDEISVYFFDCKFPLAYSFSIQNF